MAAEITKVTDAEGIEWEAYRYGPDDVIYQRECPDEECEGGLLMAPARTHGRCRGTGYIVTRSIEEKIDG